MHTTLETHLPFPHVVGCAAGPGVMSATLLPFPFFFSPFSSFSYLKHPSLECAGICVMPSLLTPNSVHIICSVIFTQSTPLGKAFMLPSHTWLAADPEGLKNHNESFK